MSTFVVDQKNLPLVLSRRSRMIGLPESITNRVVKDFVRHYRANGAVWTVDRYKMIKQIILNDASGKKRIPSGIWIRRARYNRNKLYGVYGELQTLAKQSDSQLRKVLTLLNLYTTLVNLETTPESIEKLRQIVETPGPEPDERLCSRFFEVVQQIVKRYNLDTSDVHYADAYERSTKMKDHQEEDFLLTVEKFFRTPTGIRLIDNPVIFRPLLNVLGFRGYRFSDEPEVMGKVFRIASPGLKDRWVCDFNKALDHCIKPMGKRIYDSVEKLPWDITFDESKCYHAIQTRLKKNQVVYSFDLSSATDRFPWKLQLTALRALNSGKVFNEMVSLYDELIHMPALLPDGSLISWRQGQPLGAYPSFATFTFTHGALLYALSGENEELFFVHGDDVVILDDDLAKKYARVMHHLGVPFSYFKTLQSRKMAEINSKVITASHILTIPKWKPITRNNTLGQIKNWGLEVIKFLKLSDKESRAYIKLASLPVALGGAGVNPYGLPLEKRMEGLEDILFKEKELSYEGSARRKVLSRYLHNPNFRNLLGNALRDAERSDQEALKDLPYRVYGDHRDLDILSKNSYSVNPELSRPIQSESSRPREDEVRRTVKKIENSNIFGSL